MFGRRDEPGEHNRDPQRGDGGDDRYRDPVHLADLGDPLLKDRWCLKSLSHNASW
jgi:hypothetical protein